MKIRYLVIAIVLGVFSVVFSSCERESSEDVNQDRIYVYYELLYNQQQDITYARATFYFGGITGTKLELTAPSEVKADGQYLTWKPLLAYYETSFAGLRDTASFSWTDTDGDVFVNGVSIHEIDLPQTLDTIHAGGSYELFWVGDTLRVNETVGAYINGPLSQDGAPVYQVNIGTLSVIVPANITLYYTPGSNDVSLRRNYHPAIQEATTVGAEIHGVYQTNTSQVIVATD